MWCYTPTPTYALIVWHLIEHYIHYVRIWSQLNNVLIELAWGIKWFFEAHTPIRKETLVCCVIQIQVLHFFSMAKQLLVGQDSLIIEASWSHSGTPYPAGSFGRVIGLILRPLLDNTQHPQEVDVHASSRIWTCNLGTQAAADPYFRLPSHQEHQVSLLKDYFVYKPGRRLRKPGMIHHAVSMQPITPPTTSTIISTKCTTLWSVKTLSVKLCFQKSTKERKKRCFIPS